MNGQLFKLNNARVHKGGDSSVQILTCCFLFLNFLVFCSTRSPFGLAIQLWLELAVVFSCSLVLSQPFVVLEFTGKISISILLDSELRYFSASTSLHWFAFCECTTWGKEKELPRKKLFKVHALYPPDFGGKKEVLAAVPISHGACSLWG